MNSLYKPLSIKIIYWLTNIIFWLSALASVVALIIGIGLLIGFFNDLQLHVGVPVGMRLLETGTLDINLYPNLIDVEFVEMYGKIHFVDTPEVIGRTYGVFILIVSSIFFYISFIFRQFINNVYKGKYFDFDNIALLKRIAYALSLGWIVTAVYAYFQYFFVVINLNFDHLKVDGDVQTYPVILLAALFIWVLSHVFMKGCLLQDESNLTV